MSRPLLGKPTPCVGREAELSSLEAQLASCIEESEARAVLVTAPPGAGKSRLRHELLRRIERRGEAVTILAGRGDAMSAGAPYGILAAAIRVLAGVGSSDAKEEQRRRLRDRVGQHVDEADRERVVRFVGELCLVPFPDEDLPMLQTARQQPKIMADCLRRAVLDWLAAECGAGPLLVVLDDLHWGDALTVSVVDTALREQAGTPFFVLALARPEVHETFPRLWSDHRTQEIVLRGLSRKACGRLIREVLGKDVPRAALDRAIDQSAGNALFLEELIRSIAEGKAGGAPETVVAMLQARIGRLPAGPRRALSAASVFGQTFWGGGVARVLGLPAASREVGDWLSALIDEELIQPSPASRLPGEKEHGFRHALMRDAAYGLLTPSDVATGHRLAGEFLEAIGEPDAAVVADHFERGGDPERAATSYLRAAEESLLRGDYTGGRRLSGRGIGCAPEGEARSRLNGVACYAEVYVAYFDTAMSRSETARAAFSQLRPGSLGWCHAVVGAIWSDIDEETKFELASLFGGTTPEPDALGAYIDAQLQLVPLFARSAPEPVLQAYLDGMATSVERASETIPAVTRHFLLVRGIVTLWRHPRPWSAMTDMVESLRLARGSGRSDGTSFFENDLRERARLVGSIGRSRTALAGGCWRWRRSSRRARRGSVVLGLGLGTSRGVVCEGGPDEQAREQAEALLPRALPETAGNLRVAEGIRARVRPAPGGSSRRRRRRPARRREQVVPILFWPPVASGPRPRLARARPRRRGHRRGRAGAGRDPDARRGRLLRGRGPAGHRRGVRGRRRPRARTRRARGGRCAR